MIDGGTDVLDPPDRAVARHRHVDETSLALEHLPVGCIHRAAGGVAVKLDFVILVALAFDAPFPLLDIRRQPGNIEMVQGFKALLRVDPGSHGRRGPQNEPLAALIRSEEHTSELQSLMRISYAAFCL